MAGLAIGSAFLTGFGFGTMALVVWSGMCLVLALRHHLSSSLCIVILLAAAAGGVLADRAISGGDQPLPGGAFHGRLRVVNGPFLTRSGQRFTAAPPESPVVLLCVYAPPGPRPFTGDLLIASGIVTQLEDLPESGRAALKSRSCQSQLRAQSMAILDRGRGVEWLVSRYRVALAQFLMRAAPGDTGALLSGLATGDDGALSEPASHAFRNSGTSHITAISGANFAMIVLLLGILASGSLRRNPGFILMATVAIWTYALLVGLQPSVFRAALLATAVLIGRWLGRAPDLLTLTILLAAAQVAIRPNDFDTLGFQLSLAATLALIVVFDGREHQEGRSTVSTIVLSVVAAQLATMPILALRLGTVSGIGLLANMVVGPLAALTFPVALAGALIGQISAGVGIAILQPAILAARTMLDIVLWADSHLPNTVQLGPPTAAAALITTLACWIPIFWMSGDLRRMARHWRIQVRAW